MTSSPETTRSQYEDDANLAARQRMFDYLVDATPLAPPLDDLSALAGQRVLDIGCGNGSFLTSVTEGGAHGIGADASLGMVQAAQAASGAPVGQARAEALPFADNSFDTVLALWMLYHVDDKPTALRELVRVLQPEGTLLATTNSDVEDSLDVLITGAMGDVTGTRPERWHPPLDFNAENGAAILASEFSDVLTHEFGTTFAVTDADVIVGYVRSLAGPMREHHLDLDLDAILQAVERRSLAALETADSITIERRGAVFIARP